MNGNDDPFIVNKESPDFNADKRAIELSKLIDERAQNFITDEIFVVFGDDFKFVNALWYYEDLDKMINYMNENYSEKYHFKYSTPSDYIDALQKHNVEWPSK